MDINIFKKFSDKLKKVLILAEKTAEQQGKSMDTEHQLLALILVRESLASEILSSFDITADKTQLVASLVGQKKILSRNENISEDAKEAIRVAVLVASQYGHNSIDTEHLLLALISSHNFNSYTVVERIGVNPEEIKKQIETIFGGIKETLQSMNQDFGPNSQTGPNMEAEPAEMEGFGPIGPFGNFSPSQTKTKQDSFLGVFTSNLTKSAQNNKLDPVIGRDTETERLIQILCRRTKNNPVLIGEPGTGKTSIVEGLAQRIVEGRVPIKLAGKEILSIDIGALLAGTMYRGQFESRVKKLLSEIKRSGNTILFIDEIHTVVGAGSTEGSIDAANLLKPMLARGELHLIGSTTLDEYKKHIEKDAAFERRFQPIIVKEPSAKEALDILKGVRRRYESYHHVKFTPESLEAAVRFSARYINDRYLPDKAIDLIDEAAAATNTTSHTTAKLALLRKELRQILRQKENLIMEGLYEKATLLHEKELLTEVKIKALKAQGQTETEKIISVEEIARVVSKWTGIPVADLTIEEKKRYLDLEIRLKKHIVGQDEAVSEVARAIRRARVGIGNPNRPTGSFIFLGPTGVGKTELAKVLAGEVLGDRRALIKIDMSEFMEKHNISRLIGAPAGYIGYEEGGKLTEAVRRNPYAIILFDEIEKAHPEVFNILLQIMEDGELTDARGRKVDFKNTILVMTSNLGTDLFDKQSLIGFADSTEDESEAAYERLKEGVFEDLEEFFRPEFINRVDKIIVFRPLTKESIEQIVDLQFKELAKRMSQQKINLKADKKSKSWIAQNGFDPDFGARPIRKTISDHVEDKLAEEILRETFLPGDSIGISVKDGEIVLSKI